MIRNMSLPSTSLMTLSFQQLLAHLLQLISHMVGNTYPYTPADWLNDIKLASSSGIDAFALNMGTDPWQSDRVTDAYAAATSSGTGFKMFLSLVCSDLFPVTPTLLTHSISIGHVCSPMRISSRCTDLEESGHHLVSSRQPIQIQRPPCRLDI